MPVRKADYEAENLTFTQISNEALRDNRLSFEARGLMAYMLTFPKTWTFHKSVIMREQNVGRDKLDRCIRSLEEFGYIKRGKRLRNKDGRLAGYDLTVVENPNQCGKTALGESNIPGGNQCGKTALGEPVRVSSDWKTAPINTYNKERASEEAGLYPPVREGSRQGKTSIVGIETSAPPRGVTVCPHCGAQGEGDQDHYHTCASCGETWCDF